jgi:DNA-3-methyladenine glycosylase
VLPYLFYARDADCVARELLGQVLVVNTHVQARCRIVETEAYMGEHDLACHAAKGRTARTEVMFGPAGVAYVYLIYGMYDMLNIVTSTPGNPQAVLIRAVEPLTPVAGKTDGPGKLTRVLGITRRVHNGIELSGPELWLEAGETPERIQTSPRINVDYAGAWRDAPLRFFDATSPFVSKTRLVRTQKSDQ